MKNTCQTKNLTPFPKRNKQVQVLIDMVKGVPREDLPQLMKAFKEISRVQGMIKEKEAGRDS